MTRNSNLCEPVMHLLQDILSHNHKYAHIYRHIHEVLAAIPPELQENVMVQLCAESARPSCQYDLPSVDEIAVVIPGDGTQYTDSCDIVLTPRSGSLHRINDAHPAYACLHYVLLFPWGSLGWSWDMYQQIPEQERTNRSRLRVSQCQFYASQLHPQQNKFPAIFYGGRLFQQYIVDVWASTDQRRLSYLTHNQPVLRAALYSGMEDALRQGDQAVDPNELGQRTVLPSSYTGGPRYMHQLFQDAMALAHYFHRIDLFITVTCNPSWPKITAALLLGQTASDRPDLVARVFAIYKTAVIRDLYDRHIFGTAVGYIHTIEFQKRGLPHMHLLLFLSSPWKVTHPPDVDSIVRAYWPNPVTEPHLFNVVKSCMVHRPCGAANP
jgi:hypothetical protein